MKPRFLGQKKLQKKILIIGGGGFIGSWLTNLLISLGHKIFIIDPFYNYSEISSEFLQKVLNFRNKFLIKGAIIFPIDYMYGGTKIMEDVKPDIVIDLAAISIEGSTDPNLGKKQVVDHTILTESIVSDVKKNDVDRFLYISSIFANGDIDDWSTTEKTPLNPKTPYGISKAIGEIITKSYLSRWNIVRTTSVYGFGDANMRVAQVFVNKAIQKETFWVNQDALLDFTYVKDLVSGITSVVLSKQVNEIFQITGGGAVLLPEFVYELKKHFPDLKYELQGKPDDRPKRGTMDITKIRILLGWNLQYSLENGIKDYLKYAIRFGHG